MVNEIKRERETEKETEAVRDRERVIFYTV